MSENYINDFAPILNSGMSNTDTSISLSASASVDGGFRALIESELLLVTAGGTTTTWTVTRGIEGTTAVAHSGGTAVHIVLTKGSMDQIRSDMSMIGTYASLPSSGQKKGDRYRCTDSGLELDYDGSAWQAFYGHSPILTLPLLSGLSWVNQGSTTADDSTGPIFVSQPSNAAVADIWAMLVASLPSPPYTVTLGAIMQIPQVQASQFGLVVRDSSSGKFQFSGWAFNSGGSSTPGNIVEYYNSPTSFNSTKMSYGVILGNGSLCWVRIKDDGTNRKTYYSQDGNNFVRWHSIGNTDFVTPDQYGIGVDAANGNTQPVSATVFDLSVTSP